MTIPSPNPNIFVPGKIIQVRSRTNPLILAKLVLISVEEHIRHVAEMLEWLYPDASEVLKAGTKLHDVGKKVGARWDFLKGLKVKLEGLRADFYGKPGGGNDPLSPVDSAERYVRFAHDDRHRRFWPIREETGELADVRMDLDPPFGNHAADVTEDDLVFYSEGGLDLQHNPETRNYVLNLVRLHHSFQADRIIPACSQHGEVFVGDLYRLIVADHMGSRWAEYVVQQLEEALEKPDREDFFGDVGVSVVGEPQAQGKSNDLKAGMVRLGRDRLPEERGPAPEKELLVRYHAVEVNWDLDQLAEEAQHKGDRKTPKTFRGRKPRL